MVIKLNELTPFLENISTKISKTKAREIIDDWKKASEKTVEYFYVISGVPRHDYRGSIIGRTGLIKEGNLLNSFRVEYGNFRDMRITANRKFVGKGAYIENTAKHAKYLIKMRHAITRERGAYDFTQRKYIINVKSKY